MVSAECRAVSNQLAFITPKFLVTYMNIDMYVTLNQQIVHM